ncbi:MAG: multiheme c-type cytochrome [Gammaproteobacteria bacterium]
MGLRHSGVVTLPFPVGYSLVSLLWIVLCACFCLPAAGQAADTVPMEVQMPGTQPGEAGNLETVDKCDNCHQDDDPVVSIAHDWRGSMMSHAGRDPLLWATMAIAEQDFDGAGDLCIRCHMMGGWQAGSSTPTDGSALSAGEAADGVGCDVCHKMTNTDDSEHAGAQFAPFVANDGGTPPEGYYGSAQLSLWDSADKLGPYGDAVPKHQWMHSLFHRSVDFCGACHDVSNPVVGDLAPNNGAQQPLDPATFDGQLNTAENPRNLEDKAAFNNPPYKYGVVERTYSEYKAGLLSQTLVSDYAALPADLQDGAIQIARDAALGAGTGGNYADGAPRYFSCQTCHMAATSALGCNKNGVPLRSDQPKHDLTGGNYWMPEVIQYMDSAGTLLLGDGLSSAEISGMESGIARAQTNLKNAASLTVTGNTVRVVNLTGHKLISGYPEGRRMWLNIKWYDTNGAILPREDGAYGDLQLQYDANGDGANDTVRTLLDLSDPNSKVYEAHGAITQEWAQKLLSVSAEYASVPVAFDRMTGAITHTVGDIAALDPGEYHETFHFVLNNKVVKDNRIPPYGMAYDEALKRSILPVPATQYGDTGPGGTFNYWDDFLMSPPAGAVTAEIRLMYQPTSWEYIQFLDLANNGSVAFLANEGANLLDAWLNTGVDLDGDDLVDGYMAEPYPMATATWETVDTDGDGLVDSDADVVPVGTLGNGADGDGDGFVDSEESWETDPFQADTDGDRLDDGLEVANDSDPNDAASWPQLADADCGPLDAPDGQVNAADLVVATRIAVQLQPATALELAHCDMVPAGVPDDLIDAADLVLILQQALAP